MKTDESQNSSPKDAKAFYVTCAIWILIVVPDFFGFGSDVVISQWLRGVISIIVTLVCVALAFVNQIRVAQWVMLCFMVSYVLLLLWQTIAG